MTKQIPLVESEVVHESPMIVGFCKRGHPRTKETTHPRKVRIKGKLYIVRECRICHAMRENARKGTPSWSIFRSKSKWSDLRGGEQ